MKLSEIRDVLRDIRVVPVKTLGQNFLHDQNLARWIVREAKISADDFVIEIGPGLGAITEPALDSGAHILAIEKDRRLADFLCQKFQSRRLEVLHDDALDFDVRRLFPNGPIKLLGNLPYYISTELLFRFLESPTPITMALLMLQKETAGRLSAQPRSKDYGILSLAVQSRYCVEYLRTIAPTVFLPEPEVESAIVRLTPRLPNEFGFYDRGLFLALVRCGFSQRRKQLGKLLREMVEDWPTAAREIGASLQSRAEELSPPQWIALTKFVQPSAEAVTGNDAAEEFDVVDQNDIATGAAPRREVHGNNFRHRAVHIFIFNRKGELLLQKRSPWKDRNPELWDSSAAGHVAAGEEYDRTADRELEEELGVRTKLTRVVKIPASERTGQEFIWLYRGEHEGPFVPAPSEIDLVQFFAPASIAHWIDARPGDFAPGFIECWRAAELWA
jgi:16S rRNA (adenine1518-N6/adenine1519-N6)-dimethyltransferase